jgi:hypothetical protein
MVSVYVARGLADGRHREQLAGVALLEPRAYGPLAI